MTHQESVQEMAVERYLLGELTGETKDAFEEHYFECPECASHLKDGARLVDALPAVLPNIGNSENSEKDRRVAVFPSSRWLRILTPALAASLLVIGYQSAVLVPGLKRQIAALDTPQLAENLVLANGSARGAASDAVVTRASGALMLSIDIPAAPRTRSISAHCTGRLARCSGPGTCRLGRQRIRCCSTCRSRKSGPATINWSSPAYQVHPRAHRLRWLHIRFT